MALPGQTALGELILGSLVHLTLQVRRGLSSGANGKAAMR